MSGRYIPKPASQRAWWGEDDWREYGADTPAPTVEFDERVPKFTGLYDADGTPLYRLPEPIGFKIR